MFLLRSHTAEFRQFTGNVTTSHTGKLPERIYQYFWKGPVHTWSLYGNLPVIFRKSLYVWKGFMRHAWQGLPHRQVPTKGTSLWRRPSGVIRAASLVSCNGTPAGESRTSCSWDPRRRGEHLSSATFPGGRDWDVCSLEIAAPWNTVRGRVGRPISWGTEERRTLCTACTPLFPRGAGPH